MVPTVYVVFLQTMSSESFVSIYVATDTTLDFHRPVGSAGCESYIYVGVLFIKTQSSKHRHDIVNAEVGRERSR